MNFSTVAIVAVVLASAGYVYAVERPANIAGATSQTSEDLAAVERGYRFLRDEPLIPPDFDEDVFDNVWKVWPEPLRSQAEAATPAKRRRQAFSRYGLTPDPEDTDGTGPPLGYTRNDKGRWVMNCMACHAGKVAGKVVPGLPNSHFGLQTLIQETMQAKLMMGRRLSHLDLLALKIPLGETHGATNAVVFGVVVGLYRDPQMNVVPAKPSGSLVHHDMDAPPWWHLKKKSKLYIDGFAPKNHRMLMQFMLHPDNDRERVMSWEKPFGDVMAYLESLEPPAYPWKIDRDLAARGKLAYGAHCAECHGTYGEHESWPERMVPIEDVGTDRVRLDALSRADRERVQKSWLSYFGEQEVLVEPAGYIAPPLDGVWASAPYFHNGSVPTLWHVLHPDERPKIWRRTEDGYDRKRVGLEVQEFTTKPKVADVAEQRSYFDTTRSGKSAAGHTFPDALTEDEKQAVLEYLKTL